MKNILMADAGLRKPIHPGTMQAVEEVPHVDNVLESLDRALEEMKDIYKEREPYVIIPTLAGNCYRWTDIFIYNCLIAMATDALVQFTEDEMDAWWDFVSFEDHHSTSALNDQANGTAVGCTNYDPKRKSFVVDSNWNVTNEICYPPSFDVLNQAAWKSLDQAFMDLYMCREIDDCDRIKPIYSVDDCDMNNKKYIFLGRQRVQYDNKNVYI